MSLAHDLRSAAHGADTEAGVCADPAFLRPHAALQAAARSLGQAWSGSWLPGLSSLYDRHLHALPLPLRLQAGQAAVQAPPALLARCRVWTPNQIREVIQHMAEQRDTAALARSVASASARLDDVRVCFQALLGRMHGTRGRAAEVAALAAAARRIRVPHSLAIVDSWRPAFDAPLFEAPPPHLAELAALEAMLGPFEALRQFANLMRCAAERTQAPSLWRAVLTPHLLARRVEFCPT